MVIEDMAGQDSNLRPSGYESEPGDRLDYVELGFKRISGIELRGDRLGSMGHVAPFVAPAIALTTRSS